jgi:hypothetical protein
MTCNSRPLTIPKPFPLEATPLRRFLPCALLRPRVGVKASPRAIPQGRGAKRSGLDAGGGAWHHPKAPQIAPTADDGPVTFNGRRLDSPVAVKEWLADLALRRAAVAVGNQ